MHKNAEGSVHSTTPLLTLASIDSLSESIDLADEFQRSRGKEITRRRGAVKHQKYVRQITYELRKFDES